MLRLSLRCRLRRQLRSRLRKNSTFLAKTFKKFKKVLVLIPYSLKLKKVDKKYTLETLRDIKILRKIKKIQNIKKVLRNFYY